MTQNFGPEDGYANNQRFRMVLMLIKFTHLL